jgi:hypothetical protein
MELRELRSFTDEVVTLLLAREGFDPQFGPRPKRRKLQRLVVNSSPA